MRAKFSKFILILTATAALAFLIGGTGCKKKEKKPKKPVYKKTTVFGYEKNGLTKEKRKYRKRHLRTPEELEIIAGESDPETATLVFVGDIMIWDRMTELINEHGWDYPFRGVAPLLKKADFTVGNLEGPLTVDGKKRARTGFYYKVPPESVQGLTKAGFDAVSLGNNHLQDCRDKGLADTIETLEKAKIGWFGAGSTNEGARAPYIADVKGVKVAILGGISSEVNLYDAEDMDKPDYVKSIGRLLRRQVTLAEGKNKMGTFIHTPETIAEDVANAKKDADIVIVFLHMGVRYWRPPSDIQTALAKSAADAGADLVIGHHAHFWQPTQMMGTTPVIYGIGNFAFGSRNRNADEGILVRTKVDTKGRRLKRVELYPTFIKNANKRVNYQVKILKGEAAKVVLNDMLSWSEKLYGQDLKIEDDKIIIDLPDKDIKAGK